MTDVSAPPNPIQPRRLASPVRRILAWIIDLLFLPIVGWLSGFALFEFYVSLGALGRIVGYGIALLYFGIFGSRLFKGQTLGKNLVKIELIGQDGRYLSLRASFSRYALILAALFLTRVPMVSQNRAIQIALGILNGLSSLFLFSVLYFVLFDGRRRQGIHDKIFHTFVARKNSVGHLDFLKTRNVHYIALPALAIASIAALFAITGKTVVRMLPGDNMKEMKSALVAIKQNWFVRGASINKVTRLGGQGAPDEPEVVFDVKVFVNRTNFVKENVIKVANLVLNTCDFIRPEDGLSVALLYGYDIGISRRYRVYGERYTKADWRRLYP